MTNLEKLLNGIEVEWKPLGEVCEFLNGYAFKSNLFHDTGLPIVRITNIDGKNINLKDVKFFDPADYNNGNPLNYAIVKGDILIAMSGATTGKIGYYNIEETAYLNQRVGKFIPNKTVLNSRYLYHFLLTKSDFLYILAGGGAQPNLSSNSIKEKLFIPIPPIAIQNKIADILDKFATLEAELEAELDCRKRQYDYYRNKLLSYDMLSCDGELSNLEKLLNGIEVEWKPLGEVTEIKRGTSITKNTSNPGIYPVISGGQQPAYYIDQFNRNGETITIAGSGAYAGFVMYWNKPIFVSDSFSIKTNNNQVLLRYIYHYLLNIQDKIHKLKSGGGVPHVYAKDVARFLIPIPFPTNQEKSLNIQHAIVETLDKFTQLEAELEAELNCRRKQYEYYRNKLLSFPNAKITQ